MKKKILTMLLMSVLIMASFTFVGCDKIKLKDNPAKNAPVTSNGGLVVQKGDYIYFANGYVSTDSLENGDNKYNKVTYSAIYRAKTQNSALNYDVTTNEDEEEVKTLKDVELLIPKVVSCENGSFFIFDNYIYYASPTIEKDKTGNSRFDLITFFCCKIDGTDTKKLFAVDEYGSNAKFNMIKVEDRVYIEIFDGSNLTILNVKDNKVKETYNVSEGSKIGTVILPKEETYNAENNTIENANTYVYYTRDVLESEKGYANCNVLCRVSVKTGKEEIMVVDNMNTITLLDYNNGYMYYQASNKNDSTYICYASSIESIMTNGIKSTDKLSYIQSDNVYAIKTENYVGIIINNESKLTRITSDMTSLEVIYQGDVTVLAVDGDYVYAYDSSNKIYMINIITKEVRTLTNGEQTLYFTPKTNFDICGSYVYYFNTYEGDSETGYYLNRVEVNSSEQEGELLGMVDSKFIKTKTEDAE